VKQGEALCDLATVLTAAGKSADAARVRELRSDRVIGSRPPA
jgi:hypothetical protein